MRIRTTNRKGEYIEVRREEGAAVVVRGGADLPERSDLDRPLSRAEIYGDDDAYWADLAARARRQLSW